MKPSIAIVILLGACGSDVETGRRCMAQAERCAPSQAGSSGAPDFGNTGGGGGAVGVGENALHVRIEDIDEMAIEILTLACAGDCADIEAVARGGVPPYTFEWEDGTTNAARRVCLEQDTTLRVRATDTAIVSDEFPYAAHSVSAEVSARVLACADAGVTADGGAPSGPLCIENPSFEGTPIALPGGGPFDALPWSDCPDGIQAGYIVSEATYSAYAPYPAAAEGATYGALTTNSGFGGFGSLAQTLCEPIPAGESRSFLIDIARMPRDPERAVEAVDAQIQVFGGSTPCMEEELLWTSPLLSAEWTSTCVTLTPAQTVTSISFRPLGDGNPLFLGLMTAFIDDIRPVDACN